MSLLQFLQKFLSRTTSNQLANIVQPRILLQSRTLKPCTFPSNWDWTTGHSLRNWPLSQFSQIPLKMQLPLAESYFKNRTLTFSTGRMDDFACSVGYAYLEVVVQRKVDWITQNKKILELEIKVNSRVYWNKGQNLNWP